MADKKPLNKQIPSSMTYPNPYAEGEFFSPSNVQLNIENISMLETAANIKEPKLGIKFTSLF